MKLDMESELIGYSSNHTPLGTIDQKGISSVLFQSYHIYIYLEKTA